ncbi:phage tail tape measure protein [Curtobacterium sp. ISL-83]|uniref:phage tail tape measure protein n=1 Tax=Curtobacterium sp. ISL-83 TaxID=2819145 RepID=UPI001BE92538|nr:phage tail tape measure protein [Curtobacterium sp. ISL-83]MBT2502975.1 phage tail tape measure protein [Curtobacterium sp. ISL-83]
MSNRTTKVSLVAEVSGYISGMDAAAQKTRELGSESEKLGQKREAFEGLGRASLAFGAVAAASVGLAVAKYAEFDAAMSSVQAATHASASEMGKLREAAIDAGAKTVFTATEAANAIEELSKAGIQTSDILGGGLAGSLNLASAGQLKVADAAQIAATAMTQFNLKGSQVPHVADLLAAGAGKAQGDVTDLAAALNQGGLVASQAGFKIEETTGVLASFAAAGLLGSDAGTSLKTAILALENPSTKAAATMQQYGIDVYDSSGKMLSFGGIAAQLKDKLGDLTDEQRNAALAQIFGNDAVRAANVLYSNGAKGISDWTNKVNDNGYAAETARLKLDNLKGDVEKLGGSFDTALIQTGSAANGTLRNIVHSATFLVDKVGSLPGPVLAVGVAVTTLAGGFALVGGAALVAVPKFAAFKVQLGSMGISLKTAAVRTIGAGAAFAGLSLGIGALVSMQAEASAATAELTETLDKQTGAVTKYTRAAIAKRLSDGGEYEAAKKAGVSQRELTDAVIKGGSALEAVQKKVSGRNTFGGMFTGASYEAGFAEINIGKVADSVKDSKKAFDDQKAANADSGAVAQTSAEQYQAEAAKVSDLSTELSNLINSLNTANGANQSAISANAAYQEALAGLSDKVKQQRDSTKGYSTTLDENTAIGAANADMLSDIATKAQEAAAKNFTVDQSTMSADAATSKYSKTLAEQRQKFMESATAAGFNSDQVKALADRVFQMPSKKDIKVIADTAAASAGIAGVTRAMNALGYKTVTVTANTADADTKLNALYMRWSGRQVNIIANVTGPGAAAVSTGHVAYAEGGAVHGPGTATSDSIYARLSNGEHVLDARDVALMGGQAGVYAFRAALERGTRQFANGGQVQQQTYVPTPPQIVYAQTPAAAGSGASSVFAPTFAASGDTRRDLDDAWFLYKSKLRGGR